MGKPNIFEISFARPGAFYAGNFVDGHITIELVKVMKMRSIQIKFKGDANVSWEERNDDNTTTYSASENYFRQDVLVFGIWPGQGSQLTELLPGRHTFPFRFQLPPGVPSSFEAADGNVRYEAICSIDRPWKFDHKTKKLFSVIGVLDLNSHQDYYAPLSGNKQKTICCLCCKSGPVTAQIRIDRKGWVPGEAIRIYADISNGSSRSINKSSVMLEMTTQFFASGRTKSSQDVVAQVSRPPIREHGEDSWTGEQCIIVPPLPSSFLTGCKLITVEYQLKFVVEPSGPSLNLMVPLPIVIGTIPLKSVIERSPPFPPLAPPTTQFAVWTDPSAPSAPVGEEPNHPTPFPVGYGDMPPPSYSECITGAFAVGSSDDKNLTQGSSTKFAPICTYYNWGHTPGALPEPEKE